MTLIQHDEYLFEFSVSPKKPGESFAGRMVKFLTPTMSLSIQVFLAKYQQSWLINAFIKVSRAICSAHKMSTVCSTTVQIFDHLLNLLPQFCTDFLLWYFRLNGIYESLITASILTIVSFFLLYFTLEKYSKRVLYQFLIVFFILYSGVFSLTQFIMTLFLFYLFSLGFAAMLLKTNNIFRLFSSPKLVPNPPPPFENSPPQVLNVPFIEKYFFVWCRGAVYISNLMIYTIPALFQVYVLRKKLQITSDKEFGFSFANSLISDFLRLPNTLEDKAFIKLLKSPDQYDYFVCDFTANEVLKPITGTYLSKSKVLFQRKKGDSPVALLPIAITLNDPKMVFRPSDGEGWNLAKLFAFNGAVYQVLFLSHVKRHFPFDTPVALVKSIVPQNHPLYLLFEPHIINQLELEHSVLWGARSVIRTSENDFMPYTALSVDKDQMAKLFQIAWHGYKGLVSYQPWRFNIANSYGSSTVRRILDSFNFYAENKPSLLKRIFGADLSHTPKPKSTSSAQLDSQIERSLNLSEHLYNEQGVLWTPSGYNHFPYGQFMEAYLEKFREFVSSVLKDIPISDPFVSA